MRYYRHPAAEITIYRKCIAELSTIDWADIGLSPTMTGTAFLPIPERRSFLGGLLTDHKLEVSAPLAKLVEYGPDALPYLLENLDNKTPTKLKIRIEGAFGGLFFEEEMNYNEANTEEAKAAKAAKPKERKLEDGNNRSEYELKVGDVCYVAIGQITGRVAVHGRISKFLSTPIRPLIVFHFPQINRAALARSAALG